MARCHRGWAERSSTHPFCARAPTCPVRTLRREVRSRPRKSNVGTGTWAIVRPDGSRGAIAVAAGSPGNLSAMLFAIVGTSFFVLAAALALMLLPLPPAPAYDRPGGARWEGVRDDPSRPSLASRLRASLSARIREEYYALRPGGQAAEILEQHPDHACHLRLLHRLHPHGGHSCRGACQSQARGGVSLRHGPFPGRGGLPHRSGAPHIATGRGRVPAQPAPDELVPLYAICTVLAFLVQNFAMETDEAPSPSS